MLYNFTLRLYSITKIIMLFGVIGHSIFAAIHPELSFVESFFHSLFFIFRAIPLTVIPFLVEYLNIPDIFSPVCIGIYYIYIIVFFISWIVELSGDSNGWIENEIYWLTGAVSTKELIDAEVKANAIAEALKRQEKS